MDNSTWICIENINKYQFDRLLKVLKGLEKEGVSVKISKEKENLSKNAVKIYKNLMRPMGVARKEGFKFGTILKYNKLSLEETTTAILELKNLGLIREERGKNLKEHKIYLR